MNTMSSSQPSVEQSAPAVQDSLDKLRALQDVLHKKHEIEAQIEDLPKSLATKNGVLNRLKRTYLERNEEQEATKERIDSLRNDALESERVREGYEGQMDQIRTQREYEALDKQIRDASDSEMDFRRRLKEDEERLEQASEDLSREAEQIEEQEVSVQVEASKLKVEIADREKSLAELKVEETKIAAGLDEELLFKFERIVRSTEGYGIVPLQGPVCTGCFMTLPAHFVNRVRRAEDVLFCTHGRIVFYQDASPEDEVEEQMGVFGDEPGFLAADGEDEDEDEDEGKGKGTLSSDVAESEDGDEQEADGD